MQDIKDDLKEVKTLVIELVKESSVHNEMLRTHEARSLALQKEQSELKIEIEPIKVHVALVNKLGKVLIAVLIGALTQAVIRYLL